jgi:hypothetical protein
MTIRIAYLFCCLLIIVSTGCQGGSSDTVLVDLPLGGMKADDPTEIKFERDKVSHDFSPKEYIFPVDCENQKCDLVYIIMESLRDGPEEAQYGLEIELRRLPDDVEDRTSVTGELIDSVTALSEELFSPDDIPIMEMEPLIIGFVDYDIGKYNLVVRIIWDKNARKQLTSVLLMATGEVLLDGFRDVCPGKYFSKDCCHMFGECPECECDLTEACQDGCECDPDCSTSN